MKKTIVGIILVFFMQSVAADDLMNYKPGDFFYGVQRVTEQLEYNLCLNNEAKISVALKHVQKRMYEIESNGDSELQEDIESGIENIEELERGLSIEKRQEIEQRLENIINAHLLALEHSGKAIQNIRKVQTKISAKLVLTTKDINEEDEFKEVVFDLADSKIDELCERAHPENIPEETDEVIKLEIWDNNIVVWQRTIEGRTDFLDCNSEKNPTVTISIEWEMIEDYYDRIQDGEEVEAGDVINDIWTGRIKVNPAHKVLELWNEYQSSSVPASAAPSK